MKEFRSLSPEEAVKLVEDRISDIVILNRAEQLEAIPATHLTGMKGMWEGLVGACAINWPDDDRKILVEAALYAQGAHRNQVDISDSDVELTDEEEAELEEADDVDAAKETALESRRAEIYEQHKRKLRAEKEDESDIERSRLERMDLAELKAFVGRNFGAQSAMMEFQKEIQLWRIYHMIRDPNVPAKEKIGHGHVSGHAQFFKRCSIHPLVEPPSEDGEPDFTDVRTVAEVAGLRDFWEFLVGLTDDLTLCKTAGRGEVGDEWALSWRWRR